MQFYPFLQWECVEFAFGDRVLAYLRAGLSGLPGDVGNVYDCPLIRDQQTFSDPVSDDAPWFDPNVPASAEFLGINPTRIDLLSVHSTKAVNKARGGTVIGPQVPKGRILQFAGHMFASSERGMAYGNRWVNEVLAGSRCDDDCPSDEILLAPYCPTDDSEYRRIVGARIIDGPLIVPAGAMPECHINQLTFQVQAEEPYLFSPDIVLAQEIVSSYFAEDFCYLVETNTWPGDAVLKIEITATTDIEDVKLTMRPTYGDTCPTDIGNPRWKLNIPSLPKGGKLLIDGTRTRIRYTSPSLKQERDGVRMTSFDGPLTFPEVGPCSQACLCIGITTGEAEVTVSKVIREW